MSISRAYLTPHPPLIVPSVGRGQERQVQRTVDSMKQISREIADAKPETVVVITPHGPLFSDGIAILCENKLYGDFSRFGDSSYNYAKDNDTELVDALTAVLTEQYKLNGALIDKDTAEYFGTSEKIDHGALVPLHYIEERYTEYKVVVITYGLLSDQDLYKVGMGLRKAVEELNRSVVLVASGDLSHRLKDSGPYDYHVSGPIFDKEILELLEAKKTVEVIAMDPDFCEEAGECGKRSIDILLGALDGSDYQATLLSYEGPFGVGYGVMRFDNLERPLASRLAEIQAKRSDYLVAKRQVESLYVQLARETIELYIKEGKALDFERSRFYQDEKLRSTRRGAFVSIKDSGGLRGCIGTDRATEDCLGQEIIHNAISAATRDPRFSEVVEEELSDLVITVDVLEMPEDVTDIETLDPKIFGIIVTKDYKRGLLLPDLKGIDTVEKQIEIAKNKAGIKPHETVEIKRFRVVRHE